MISQMVSGINPVRRFPAVSRHYSPTVARRLVRAPDERIRVDPSAAARAARHLAVVRSRKHSQRSGQWNRRIPPLSCAFSTFGRRRCECITSSCSEQFRVIIYRCVFQGCFSNSVPTRRTRRTLFGTPGGAAAAVLLALLNMGIDGDHSLAADSGEDALSGGCRHA